MGRRLNGARCASPSVDRGAFRAWLHGAFSRNEPWSGIVTQLLTATGLNSDGEAKRESEANDGTQASSVRVNGAVNWTLKYELTPQDMAGIASRTFLGVQIQCAQCHDHKTEKWTQRDFQSFAAAFAYTGLSPVDSANPPGSIKRVAVHELNRPAPRFSKMGDLDALAKVRPTALDGTDLESGDGVRAALAAWTTSPNNPWFARAFVNRMWAHFLGRGFVDPVDDFRPSNSPSAPAVLDALAADFVQSRFDVKHLVRLIAGSEVYALSASRPPGVSSASPDVNLWERFRITPLGPEELLNALVAATKLDAIVRSTGRLDMSAVRFRVKQRYGFLFNVDEENAAEDYEGTIAQCLTLLNGNVVSIGASVLPGSALADVLAASDEPTGGDDAKRLESLYLRALSRSPTSGERERWLQFLADALGSPDAARPDASVPESRKRSPGSPSPVPTGRKVASSSPPDPLRGLGDRASLWQANARIRAWEDVLWALLNSSEFVLNH